MNQYETVFILTPVLSDEQMKEAVERYREFLTTRGAEILYEENWGMRKLAYNIEKKSSGFYIVMGFKAEPTVIEPLEVDYRRNERVIRYLTVKMDKNAAAYAEKREKLRNKKED
ncbi:MAG: 30S ribosomal protein S6 [Bacteroidaceae bacterium]|nr:30S ribosomal protein S6 [Bacteroidaceae bacterium]